MLEGDALGVHLTSQCAFDFFFPSIFFHHLYFSVQYESRGEKNCQIKKYIYGKYFKLRYGYSFLIKHTLSLSLNF